MSSRVLSTAVGLALAGAAVASFPVALSRAQADTPCADTASVIADAPDDGVLATDLEPLEDDQTVTAAAIPVDAPPAPLIKHVATRDGFGTAFIVDRAGPDSVVIQRPDGTSVQLDQPGEAFHPVWSSKGDLMWSSGKRVKILWADGSTRDVPAVGKQWIFSPMFVGKGLIAAAISAGPTALSPEDDTRDDIFFYNFEALSPHWVRVTGFTAGADAWSVIRTPILVAPGVIEFVRVAGMASATAEPQYQLWRLTGKKASMLKTLPDERYLAASNGSSRIWNVPDLATGEWRLERETVSGASVDMGCGAVMVDPMNQPDPDLVADSGTPSTVAAIGSSMPTTEELAPGLVIGDFSSRDDADAAARSIDAVFGAGTAAVITSADDPLAVGPGVWAVRVPVADGEEPADALASFRQALPQLAAWAWVAG